MAEQKTTRRAKLSKKRLEVFTEIDKNKLMGKEIKVISSSGYIIGNLIFNYNRHNPGKNTGYYVGDTQIPLLSIKEVGEGYLMTN